jgi:hypothetical protein
VGAGWRRPPSQWCGRRDSNPHSQSEKQIFVPPRLSPPPGRAFVVWTIPSPWLESCRRRPSSLYTFLSRGLARDWHWPLPLAFPEFERFYSLRFHRGTPMKSAASTDSATSAQVPSCHMCSHEASRKRRASSSLPVDSRRSIQGATAASVVSLKVLKLLKSCRRSRPRPLPAPPMRSSPWPAR